MALAMTAAAELRMGRPVGAAAHAVYNGERVTVFATKDYSALLEYACGNADIETPRT